ncbi:tyrosine-type recombinase/integrase [Haliea sp. E1-2-M8]|uniref:tyrosine-type recombinase/integrase n=1 Tax=Haliea sp. E1-2-M8 TaxID=3064706 RepID=UPI002724B801|nr:integrase arm-type DNA-binding domain-containing protein [Haliea sp. E1-2-M8]MDO8861530.1 tyrosine-type recombinase/integrase [Haliea sp. E1-2-M8]
MALTDTQIRQLKPQEKDVWLTDEKGLRLLLKSNGAKYWRLKYRYLDKQKTLALGVYPEVSLKAAREAVLDARRQLANGVDPGQAKKQEKRQRLLDTGNTFGVLAREWWEQQRGTWTADHSARVWGRLESDVLPTLGSEPILGIQPQDVIAVVRKIEQRDALDVASRVLQDIRRVCRYAVQTGRLTQNPATELTGILKTRISNHRHSLPREELPGFLQALEEYGDRGRLLTQLAIQLLVLTFVRSGELRGARWEEFNLGDRLWRIPASRMKMRSDHLVPLSLQAVAVIARVQPITARFALVFPSERNRQEPMSDNTMRRAIFKLGYDGTVPGKSKAVPHGFRATAASILNETGFNPDAIERQLSHMERNGVRAAYTHHARYLDERREMMQWWGNYLDQLRSGRSNVVPGSFGTGSRAQADGSGLSEVAKP